MEIDVHLQKAKMLSDGRHDLIYIKEPQDGVNFYHCILCNVLNLSGESNLMTHMRGKRHQMRIKPTFIPDAVNYRSLRSRLESKNSDQTIVKAQTFIESNSSPKIETAKNFLNFYIEKTLKPLIGIEYVIELIDLKWKEPLYMCVLCDKKCDPRNIIPQMTSHRHRINFLTKNFPKLMSFLNQISQFRSDMVYREEVLTKIAQMIEEKFGRMKPTTQENREYEQNKSAINFKISQVSIINEKEFPDIEKVLESLKILNFDTPSTSKTSLSHRSLTEIETTEKLKEKMIESRTFVDFKDLYSVVVQRIEKNYCAYFKCPDSHSDYNDEWISFWQKRYNELIKEKINPDTYNFIPEWKVFWMNRLKELKEKEIKEKIKEIRQKLELTKEQVANFLEKIKEENFELQPSSSEYEGNFQMTAKKRKISRRLLESDTDESDEEKRKRYEKEQQFKRRRTVSPTPDEFSYDENSEINIIVVCRLLAALESEIGSILLPRVIDLLEKALKLERIEANSSENLLRDFANLDLLMMIKEKLKGAVNAELVKPSRLRPVKMAIKNTAKLMFEAKQLKPLEPSTQISKEERARQEIAKVMAETLIKQGKEHISNEELQQLIDEFINSQMENEEANENQDLQVDVEKSEIKLTDEELKLLLENFSDMQDDEQKNLTEYLKILKKTEPNRVADLEKYLCEMEVFEN